MAEQLRIEKLCKRLVLEQVSLSVEKGEMTAIMGPSGSGKSTLLYQTAGMAQPDGGEVWLGDTQVTGLSEDERALLRLRRMGFVFQQMNMLANLNVLDNILLPALQATERGKRRKARRQLEHKARELMRKLGISGLEERRITEVSGGELQRACICRSMMNNPDILLADEPTGALNQSAAAGVMEEFVRLNREGTTILLVTHDARVASRCDRILYLLDGQIRGELKLGKPGQEDGRLRERRTAEWLSGLGW